MKTLGVPSMTELFRACNVVLAQELRPMHYGELTETALATLEVSPPAREFHLAKAKEDVREKMLIAGRYGSAYIPSPYCCAIRSDWFRGTAKQETLALNPVVIEADIESSIEAAFELLMRPMVQKNPFASKETVMQARAKGMIIQTHVTNWFQRHWGELYHHPDNHRMWHMPSAYDFGLEAFGMFFRVDVAGSNKGGQFGNKGKKSTTDLHLICDLQQSSVVWLSVWKGAEFAGTVIPEYGRSPENFMVFLNCAKYGIDYYGIKDKL